MLNEQYSTLFILTTALLAAYGITRMRSAPYVAVSGIKTDYTDQPDINSPRPLERMHARALRTKRYMELNA